MNPLFAASELVVSTQDYRLPISQMEWLAVNCHEQNPTADDPRCFAGETRVALLDGSLPSFEELHARYGHRKPFGVYSIASIGIVPAIAGNPRVVRRTNEICELLLDNFQLIRCTPEHLFLTLDGTYIEAKNLKPDSRLMPLYRSSSPKGGWADYEYLWCPVRGRRILTHHLVAGVPKEGNIVHHIDRNRRNNSPSNLEHRERREHSRMHTTERHRTDSFYTYKLREGHRRYRETGGNEKSRENILSLFEQGKLKRGRNKCAVADCPSLADAKRLCDVHYQRLRRESIRARASRTGRQKNHRVLSVTTVPCDVDVWILDVVEHHNFALASGIFAHTGKC
jgi:tRNA-splicing ligase RtcB